MALSGKVALVTGGAMGIGRAMVEELLTNGAKVALLDVSAAAGTSLVENLEEKFGKDKTLFIECDVQSEEQLKAAFQKIVETFGKLDIVCNNAGVFDETQWEKTVSINLVRTRVGLTV
ncbi:15-hydroxyprostaglandin dehydrogenase [NAD(+)]-like [Boleophthalmus pectinirostris]|uniref:15-hydroxyprostaglandin dehydrogenase [NAD(+)]-like n=1 Tax=Boleophthalmus pectinirostris TaxID=150288 RepID=UPI00242EBAA7|nr:15-hydroxyprostaglandin dehydrogenase [NAD(+)]-like [Boleophthalmus pectinirostris]